MGRGRGVWGGEARSGWGADKGTGARTHSAAR